MGAEKKQMPTTDCLVGVPIRVTSRQELVQDLIARAAAGTQREAHVHFVNAYTIALASQDDSLRSILAEGICCPDGRPLAWFLWLRDPSRRFRLSHTRGPQTFLDVFEKGREWGIRHYLLGGSDETLQRLEFELERRFPGVSIVGKWSPPFRPLTDDEFARQDETIRKSGAQIVWVGLGTPKQDFESARIAGTLPVIACSVGAAFSFAVGDLKTSPRWISFIGLEWLFRLVQEPRRLWRRYLLGNSRFVWLVALEILANRNQRRR